MTRAVFALALLGLPTPALAGELAGGSSPDIPWLRLLLAFAFCIALAFGAVLLLKRHQRGGGRAGLEGKTGISRPPDDPNPSAARAACRGQHARCAMTRHAATVLATPAAHVSGQPTYASLAASLYAWLFSHGGNADGASMAAAPSWLLAAL